MNTKGKRHERWRRGATVIESAIVVPVLFLVLFSLLDLGFAATRFNTLSECSRCIAREVAIHGAFAPDASGSWGPEPYSGTLADDNDLVRAGQASSVLMDPGDVAVAITWIDEDNLPRDRVRVELRYEHLPLLSGISPWGDFEITSTTIMRIVN